MTMGIDMGLEMVPVSADPVGDAIRLPDSTPDRLERIIQANAEQRQAILDTIPVLMREWSESFLGYFDEHMNRMLKYQSDRFELVAHGQEQLKAHIDESHDRMMNYVQNLTLRSDVPVRELRMEHDEILDTINERLDAIEARLNKAGL